MNQNHDLNINNYSQKELEELFDLPNHYDNALLQLQESKLRKNILLNTEINESIKANTLAFIDIAKQFLLQQTKSSTHMASLADTYKNVYNLDTSLKKSEVSADGSTYIIKQPPTPYGQSMPSEFYQGTINPLNKRILRKSLNIDTRFRDNYYNTQASNFNVVLPLRFTEVVSMQLTAMEFPTTFYAISKVFGNHFFYITIGDDKQLVTVPDGNYTPAALENYLNTYMDNVTNILFQQIAFKIDLDVGSGSGRMVVSSLTDMEVPFALNFQLNVNGEPDAGTPLPLKLGWLLGFRNGIYTNSPMYVSEGIINLLGPRYIYLVVDDYQNSVNDGFYGAFNSSILNKNILARISLQGTVFSLSNQNNLNLITNARQYFGPVDIMRLNIQLLDEYGRPLNLNNMDYSFCLTMQTIYDL